MRILLDENITPMAKTTLSNYGHDVIHILDKFDAGLSDEKVFEFALKDRRAIITINGKDFVVYIPPQAPAVKHYGLIWFRSFQVTRKNCEHIMNIIGQYFEDKESIINSYYTVRKNGEAYEIALRYPKEKVATSIFIIENVHM